MTISTTAAATQGSGQATLLRRSLGANAGFSALSGVVLIAFHGPLDRFIGLGLPWLLIVLGAGLLGFAALIALNLRRTRISRTEAWLTVASDIAWVAGSAVILLGFPDLLDTGGKWLVALAAVGVADFALLQTLGLRRSA